jgi:hypothetical protein
MSGVSEKYAMSTPTRCAQQIQDHLYALVAHGLPTKHAAENEAGAHGQRCYDTLPRASQYCVQISETIDCPNAVRAFVE